MAMQKEVLLAEVESAIAKEVSSLEVKVDTFLKENYGGKGSISVDLDHGIRPATLTRLVDRYIAAGWKAEISNDQREGSFITLQ